ncbi:protein kinase family protein [Streptomyces mayteni]
MSGGPYEPTEEIRELLGFSKRRLVMDRRGSTVWRVVGERGTWGVQPWCDGPSLWELWAPYREAGGRGEPDDGAALACARALAALHRAGWVHGDVQPAHLIVGEDGRARLIDLALARGGAVPAWCDFAFQGCLVHYESPELSREALATGTAVPTAAPDVFGLGASLHLSLTGRRVVDFPAEAERAEQRRYIAGWPGGGVDVPGRLGGVIAAMVRPAPGDRPTTAEVCAVLGGAG